MYCNYCGSLNPNDAVYCSDCGRRTSNATADTSGTSNSVTVPSSIPSIPAAEPRSTSFTAAYGWFVFSLVCFTVCAAGVVFQLAAAAAKGSADAFPEGGSFLAGLIATAIGAKTAWSRLVVAEPEADPVVRRKHSLFLGSQEPVGPCGSSIERQED
jgi:hypothetical protein